MRIIILILCCVCGNYGENNTVPIQEQSIPVTFNVIIIGEEAHCKTSKKELIVEEGTLVKLNACRINIPKDLTRNTNYNHQKDTEEIQNVKCTYTNGSGTHELGEEFKAQEEIEPWKAEHVVTKDMYGTWSCKLKYNYDGHIGEIKQTEQDGAKRYSYVICKINVRKPDLSTTLAPPINDKQANTINKDWWIIIGVVGIAVLLIIIGQTIALCYFRRKAQPRRRMDNMTTRSRFDRGDQARYSAPPCKKGKSSARAEADTDSHIYEMVGVNALYNKSSDLNPEANTDTNDSAEKNIRERPPLPLPHKIPKPVPAETLPRKNQSPMTSMASTLSLNSTSSGSNLLSKKKGKELPPPPGQGFKKAPARPPKQVDENSIPGSLRRPAMLTPAPTADATSIKTGTLAKTSATESPMSELKNMFKKRNVGKDTPTSSPAATLEKKPTPKEPPKVQAKPNTPIKSQTQKQPPNVSKKLIVSQQTPIKLILPKIEATLKAPKPLVQRTIEPTTSPIKSPPPPKKPSQAVSPKSVSQKPVTQPAPKSIQKRPLPTPELARKLPPEPILPHPVPLPPIYQAADEDLTPGTDDDEEWTYEQLGQYHIYNM